MNIQVCKNVQFLNKYLIFTYYLLLFNHIWFIISYYQIIQIWNYYEYLIMSHDCQCDTSEWTGTHNSYKFHLQFRIAYFPMLLLMMIGLGIGSADQRICAATVPLLVSEQTNSSVHTWPRPRRGSRLPRLFRPPRGEGLAGPISTTSTT